MLFMCYSQSTCLFQNMLSTLPKINYLSHLTEGIILVVYIIHITLLLIILLIISQYHFVLLTVVVRFVYGLSLDCSVVNVFLEAVCWKMFVIIMYVNLASD